MFLVKSTDRYVNEWDQVKDLFKGIRDEDQGVRLMGYSAVAHLSGTVLGVYAVAQIAFCMMTLSLDEMTKNGILLLTSFCVVKVSEGLPELIVFFKFLDVMGRIKRRSE